MTPHKRILLLLLAVLFLCSCKQKPGQEITSSAEGGIKTYISIDGLWKCTPETALHFESITLEATIQISGSMMDELSVRGCFIWDGQFRDYWRLSDITYADSLKQITIRDQSGSIYMGTLNKEKNRITGMVYSEEEGQLIPEDKLDFIRAPELNAGRLFTPREPGPDGSILYTYQVPEESEDNLRTGSIYQYVKDTAAVYRLLEEVVGQKYGRLESLLILKNQELILEEYFFGYQSSELHNVFSVTKSITSLLTGIALDEYKLSDVNQPLLDFFPDLTSPEEHFQEKMTLEHVLTMTAGFQEDDSYIGLEQQALLQHILNLPLESDPGEEFRYNKECPYLLGGVIFSLEGQAADQYSREKLFDPLGITSYKWKVENGVPHCDSHLQMLPRDMAKIGILVLNKGNWEGRQIVSADWIARSTAPHVPESPFFNYGYQWWHRSRVNQPWWKEQTEKAPIEHSMAIAIGFGGQFIFVIKDMNLVIVTTSSDYNESTGMAFKKVPMVIEEIIPLFE